MSEFRVTRIIRVAANDVVYPTAVAASEAASALAQSTKNSYAIAHTSYPLDTAIDYENATYDHALYVATHSIETMLTEQQALCLRNMGLLRSQEEIDAYDTWERTR